ncbi:LacI family DNA-binding transcriptional regulator [Herbiconiux sp. P17]|uniref:LacI family DNA-binding transcriptional regulator n=1 Tax=Herbiconiux wuyangfengii TaxID=3342794 RepID=UPI0035B8815E
MSDPTPPGRRQPTIHDVAAIAGVAASTVSRALSDPGRVNARTRERIQQAAAQINYLPSARASGLRSGKTGTVALLVPDITNPFYFDIIKGTQLQLKAAGYSQLLVDTEESEAAEADALERLVKSVDGVVLVASRLSDERLAEVASAVPLVTINREVEGVGTVVLDTSSGIEQSVEHLVSLGHRAIGYVSGPDRSWSNLRRWAAVEAATARLGVSAVRIGPFPPLMTSGAAAADAAVNSGVTACIAFNDLIAIGMLQRLAARGVAVPEQVSIVGCDDIFGADFCSPALTTITAPKEGAGRAAISLLLTQLAGGRAGDARPTTVLSTHLTIRDSTGTAPVVGATGPTGAAS